MTRTDSTKLSQEIAAANQAFWAAFRKRDPAALASFYTEDAQLLTPTQEFLVGRQAIQSFWQTQLAKAIKEANLETLEVESHGDAAIEISRFTLHGEHGPVLERGSYIVVWKRENGSWKLNRDAFKGFHPPGDPG